MRWKQFLVFLLLIIISLFANAASKLGHNPFQKQDIALLDLLYKDSVNSLNIQLNSSIYQFGLDNREFRNIALVKQKQEIWLQPLGTGKLFKVNKSNIGYTLQRIDSTIHSGVNFNSISFSLHDTLFQYGGSGFWTIRGLITYFSNSTHEWELYPSHQSVNGYEGLSNYAFYHLDTNANKLYTTGIVVLKNPPFDLGFALVDSVCAFNFETKNWTKLGPINPELKKMIDRDNFYTLHLGKLFLFRRFFDWHWVDFENNLYGNLKIEKNSEAKQKWLNLYNTKSTYQDLQFNLGNTCYLIKLDPDLNTSFASFTISKDDIDLTDADYIYKKNNFILAFYYNTLLPFFTPNVYILIIVSFFIFFVLYRQRKKRVPKEVNAILNYNFVNSLTIIEKELVQVLYQQQLKGEEISPKLINKILGVQQKDTLTQNKSRSDHFLKINQKFKLATQQDLPLIVKSRDSIDKRQYNYGLETRYLQELGNHFKS
jgi:hypothetical protein